MKVITGLAALAGVAGASAVLAAEPVQVMILGTYHMGNPGLDLANAKADDVTSPKRQAEIKAVVDELAKWRPTKVLVETQVPAPFTVASYRQFTPAELATNRNETRQIAFRLANQLGHKDVYGFDERPGPGEPEYFQWKRVEEFARKNGRAGEIDENIAYFKNHVAQFEREQSRKSVAGLLIGENDPVAGRKDHSMGYYFSLPYGDADNQVGAEFNSYWYMRNAKMFGKIGLIAEPGDRLLVLVGSGHGYWLRHFASEAPGFEFVDPIPYLKRADRSR